MICLLPKAPPPSTTYPSTYCLAEIEPQFSRRQPRRTASTTNMPPIRHASKRKAPPEGFSDIEDDLLIFSNKMKDAEAAPTTNVPRQKVHWPIFQIQHQRSRYIYELYYEKEAISKELYEWLLKNGYADKLLIAKWKKMGYEKVCVLKWGTTRDKG